jgi:diacylglycerol kinase family enzyme
MSGQKSKGNGANGSSRRKLFVIANGKKAGDEGLREGVKKLREEGHTVDVRVTWEPEDVDRYIAEALASGASTIVAAGGDGSVNQVAGALVRADAPEDTAMAVIPLGTANDFATGLGIPEDAFEALQLAASDTACPIDIGVVNDEVFVNVGTGGFGAEITESTDSGLKDSIGGAAYILTGLTSPQKMSARDAHAKIPLDTLVKQDDTWVPLADIKHDSIRVAKDEGKEYAEFDGKLLVLAVGNARQAGGGVQLCPDAQIDDGKLDVTYILNPPLGDIPKIIAGMQDDKKLEGPMGMLRCSWLEVDCPDELQINRDGEPMRAKHFNFKVLPRRLEMHMPHTDLLSQKGVKNSPRTRFSQKIEAQQQRQERQQSAFQPKKVLHHPMTKTVLKTSLVLGVGIGLGMRFQRMRAHSTRFM